MSAAPLLAALLGRALPGLAARDLGLPLGALLPWLPGCRAGLAEAEALPPEERALLAGLRQSGQPLLGLDPAADAAADPAWDGAAERLAWSPLPDAVPGATITLVAGGMGEAALPEGLGRILLVAGREDAPERHDLLVPEPRLSALFERLCQAAAALAGPGWRQGGRALSPRQASLLLLAPPPGHVPDLLLAAAALPHDLPGPGGAEGLPLGGVRQMRLLLGALPALRWRLRLGFAGAEPGAAALFLDGLRHPVRLGSGGLVASIEPVPGRALVLGLAWREGAPPGLRLVTLEARP
ncbi:hypothetical protein [Belnapia rosea]|uniref:Uncharacterized protein n=1 Tax=Belnapia rosea TaxID=938405 RepID=A0A1G6M6W0_9PROT|nr:hypothetical protein [Belnapia rosea]SDC51044.1 hypothetical protein SAMN04487779_10011113 [Belnapia rosea]